MSSQTVIADSDFPASVELGAPAAPGSAATQTPLPTGTPTATPVPTATAQLTPAATVTPTAVPVFNVQGWCEGPAVQIRDLRRAADLRTSTQAEWLQLLEALETGKQQSPPELAANMEVAHSTFQVIYDLFYGSLELTAETNASRQQFIDNFYDIDDYNLRVCGLERATKPRPAPTPTPTPTPTPVPPTPVPTLTAAESEDSVRSLMTDFGLTESEARCFVEIASSECYGEFYDPYRDPAILDRSVFAVNWWQADDLDTSIVELAIGPDFSVAIGTQSVWTTTAFSNWSRQQQPIDGLNEPDAIAWSPRGFILAGDGSIWETTDGRAWAGPTKLDQPTNTVHVEAIASTNNGVIAAGSINAAPSLWKSDASDQWTAVALPSRGTRYGSANDVAAGAAGVVAVGHTSPSQASSGATSQAAIWFSSEGTNWQVVDLPLEFPLRAAQLTEVIWSQSQQRYIAAGTFAGESHRTLFFAESLDGQVWTRIESDSFEARPTNLTLFDLAETSFGVVAVAGNESADDASAVMWRSGEPGDWFDVLLSRISLVHSFQETSNGRCVAIGRTTGSPSSGLISVSLEEC